MTATVFGNSAHAVTTGLGEYRSTNGGASWMRSTAPDTNVDELLFLPTEPDTLLAGTDANGLWLSADGGRHWTDHALANTTIMAIAAGGDRAPSGNPTGTPISSPCH